MVILPEASISVVCVDLRITVRLSPYTGDVQAIMAFLSNSMTHSFLSTTWKDLGITIRLSSYTADVQAIMGFLSNSMMLKVLP